MKTAAIVQARMGSTRLPGKVLEPLLGKPMLARQVERMRRARSLDGIVIATTEHAGDDLIAEFARAEGLPLFRGPEHDVLSRYAGAARTFGVENVVRITSDCPLMEPTLIDEAVGIFASDRADYVSNMIEPTYPYGLAVEVFSVRSLAEADALATQPTEREHVTPYLYWNPGRFRLHALRMTPDLSHHRWTVDTLEDLELVRRIYGALYPARPEFSMADVLALLEANPSWAAINAHVVQKKPTPIES